MRHRDGFSPARARECLILDDAKHPFLARRTARSVLGLGGRPRVVGKCALARSLDVSGPIWLLRAGAIPRVLPAIRRQRDRRPLIALMPSRTPDGELADEWQRFALETNGVLTPQGRQAPSPIGLYLEEPRAFARALERATTEGEALRAAAERNHVALASGLAADWSETLRVGIVVSALHRGGAERVAIDLAAKLRNVGVESMLLVLGRPMREAYPAPQGCVLVYEFASNYAARLSAAAASLKAWGADLVHAHLLGADQCRRLRGSGIPTLVTVHNARQGWPADYAAAEETFADLLVGVSVATTRELREASLGPARTIWNGIAAQPPACGAQRNRIRAELGIANTALVSVSVANRRPQKRLELIPPVIDELRAAGIDAHAIVVGGESAEGASADAPPPRQQENGRRIHWVGSQADVAAWCSAGDVYLCTSEYEGLSLAQLEALAVGLPVVSTKVGGADELRRATDRCAIVPVDATPKTFADAIVAAARPALPTPMPQFSSHRMAARHALLYRRATHRLNGDRGGLLLVANDFAPGGAQASSARLLSALAESGVPCAAFVIAEDLENPTAGTTTLRAAGIPVHAVERSRRRHSHTLAEDVIAKADELGITALAFWNAITELKVRIADLATSIPVFDVSPGEMYFTSLDRYFEKPAPELPYLCARDYGALLEAAVVKYGAEAEKARAVLNAEVHVVPNGVWLAPHQPQPRESCRTIGTIARLSPDKRIEDLVDAFRLALPRLPPCELLIGGAPDIGAERYAAALAERSTGLPIRWLGQVDPRRLLPRLDLFVLVAEPAGCPNATLEAMAAGVPALATDVGGMREQIEDGVTGWLAPRRDVRAFAARLEDALRDRRRLHETGRRAREHIRRRFSIERMRDRYRELFGLQ